MSKIIHPSFFPFTSRHSPFTWLLRVLAVSFLFSPGSAKAAEGWSAKQFLGQTCFTEVRVSPSGRHVAFVTVSDNFEKDVEENVLWRLDLDPTGRPIRKVRLSFDGASYSGLRWSPDERWLSYLKTKRGDGNGTRLFLLDMRGGEPSPITNSDQFKDGIAGYDWLPDSSGVVTVSAEPEGEEKRLALKNFYGDVQRFTSEIPRTTIHRIRLDDFFSRQAEKLATVDGSVSEISVSPDGKTFAYVTSSMSGHGFLDWPEREIYVIPALEGAKPRRLTNNAASEGGIQWEASGSAFYAALTGEPRSTQPSYTQGRILRIEPSTGEVKLQSPEFQGSFNDFVVLSSGKLLASGVVSTSVDLFSLSAEKSETRRLTSFRGSIANLSASSDGKTVAFVGTNAKSFQELFLASGNDRLDAARAVTDFNAELNKSPLPEIEVVSWPNGEGDAVEGVLFWPPGKRGAKKLPLVVDIHGGPWSVRTEAITLGSSSALYYPALLASRGYLVLEPNYRGGTGRGEAFLKAIEGYSCSRPATDVLTGVDFLVSQGWADSNRMGVMGFSYGGLLTNCLIGRTDRFKAACSGAGIWNDISYFGTADNTIQNLVRNRGKSPWEDFKTYWEESAISKAGEIKTPTLVVIGGADRRVPTTQAHELFRALVRNGVKSELLVFPNEGHGLRKPVHKKTKIEAELSWLDFFLGDRGSTKP